MENNFKSKKNLYDELVQLDEIIKKHNPFQKRVYYMNKSTFTKMLGEHQAVEIPVNNDGIIFQFMGCECHISELVENNCILFKTKEDTN